MGKYLLGLDNGGTMIKAALYDLKGNEVAISSSKTVMYQPQPGFTERNVEEMWQANVTAIKGVIAKAGIDGSEIIGLAATGHGNGLYLVRADGSQTTNGMISTDVRGREYVIKWQNDGTHDKILPKTMQSVFAGQPTTLLRWFIDHQPEVLEETRWIFMCKDYIRFRLTGEAYGEIADMSGSSLMNVRDVKYDRELLRDMGLESIYDKLPPLRYSGEVCGTITKEVAALTGLAEGTPVAGGCMDIHASAMAVGITDEDKLCVVAGTWSINEYISKQPVVDKDLFMTSIYPIPGYWMILEGSPTSASNLEWFLTEILRDIDLKEQDVYEYSNNCVNCVADEDCGVVFLPFLYASNVNINAKACFVGLSSYHNRDNMLRAVYEGIVFSHKYHIEKLLKYRKAPKSIRIAGGVAKSRVWVQMFADILQVPIEVTECTELGALGAAICAGVATGAYESFKAASDVMVEIAFTAVPNPDKRAMYEKKYNRYLKVIKALDGIWDEY
ncbi:MAG: carbohydrate kinase [Acetobacterium sp. MES1]|uniref:FGGY-family carbohydrate kinase n=1 Tax=Acetobacterium TaxID=33951 RepID=UPI000B9D2918|nr:MULTISPECIES: FGGY-family carbohydrate kinase [Acetobacterium]OXS26061.1 MAG: carbohydrate kinase [Acetobacterium sp. MES1]URN82890.1 carbohydrate kinase [Acetobacterium wieringae]